MGHFKEKVKDVLYDKNDLLVALVILTLAGLLIYNRIGVIMDYPSLLAAQAASGNNNITSEEPLSPNTPSEPTELTPTAPLEPAEPTPAAPGTTTPAEPLTDPPSSGSNPSATTPPAGTAAAPGDVPGTTPNTKKTTTIRIESGSTGSQIAQLLIDSGLILDKREFYNAVRRAGAETRLQAGQFKIPAGATADQIVGIITR